MADLQFNMRFGDYEVKACPKTLARFSVYDKNETIDFVKHYENVDGKDCVYSIGYFYYDTHERGWELMFVGDRFLDIEDDAVKPVWEMLKAAYKVLDAWDRSGINEM